MAGLPIMSHRFSAGALFAGQSLGVRLSLPVSELLSSVDQVLEVVIYLLPRNQTRLDASIIPQVDIATCLTPLMV